MPNYPRQVKIVEVGPRDGLQNEPGIVATEMAQAVGRRQLSTQHCPHCSREGHDRNARFCKFCGGELDPE